MVATRGQAKRKHSETETKDKSPVKAADGKNSNSMDTDEPKVVDKANEKDTMTLADIINHCRVIEKAVTVREFRSMGRIIRELNTIRKRLSPDVLSTAITTFVDVKKCSLQKFLPSTAKPLALPSGFGAFPHLPECDAYIHLLLVIWLLDNQTGVAEMLGDCIEAANALIARLSQWSERRGIDHFQARAYFFQAQALSTAGVNLSSLFGTWHKGIKTAMLRSNVHSQATLYNLLLRCYLGQQQYEQAEKFMKQIEFPKQADNNQWSRYYYYTGRVKAVQLEYSDARQKLVQALRKAPTAEETAVGFKQTVAKLLTTVQLLLGEIPDRAIFFKYTLKNSLAPYYELTQSVRSGDLQKFSQAVQKYRERFEVDGNLRMVMRLRHNVIKTGIRQIATSYSKISLSELAQKLNLDNADDAEFIVAKAIKDGVIEAEIDHQNKWMISHDSDNIYVTKTPQQIFQERIDFCFDINRQSILAMRYPDKDSRLDGLLDQEQMREREKEETELANELAEEDDDDDDFME